MASTLSPKAATSLTKSANGVSVAVPGQAVAQVLHANTGTLLTVGTGQEFATLAAACKAAVNGDTIAVKAGTYVNDFAVVNANVKIIAVGGLVNEVATTPPPNDKGIFTVNANLTIQGFTFTGGSDGSPDGNVAGIRLQAGSLNASYCYFHDMQEGLLADPDPTATVTIDHCEFANNGTGDGYSHNIYVGSVAQFTATNSYFTGANVGHEIKSRALVTNIINNVIADGPTGTASYDIDIPNAGAATIYGNIIEKGPNASNSYAIHYGGETQYSYAKNSLLVQNNTIINDMSAQQGVAVLNQSNVNGVAASANITKNSFYNFLPANLLIGPGTLSSNTTLSAEPAYTTNGPYLALPNNTIAAGPQLLNLAAAANTINGGKYQLTINDTGGSNTIGGGAGGLNVNASAGWDVITTKAGANDALTLGNRSNIVTSAGHDKILSAGQYDEITATAGGQASITATNFGVYDLNGQDVLTNECSGILNVGATGNVAALNQVGDLQFSVAAGGRLLASDPAGSVPGAPGASVTITGGAVTGWVTHTGYITVATGGSGANVVAGTGIVDVTGGTGNDSLTAGSGSDNFILGNGTDRTQFGTGAASVTGGTGTDTYVFASGGGGQDTITGFKLGTDVLAYTGFAAAAVTSGTVAGGDTLLTLADGTTIDLVGVILPGYPTSGTNTGGGAAAPINGAGSLVLATSGQTINGTATALSLTDNVGSNSINGGTGGLTATLSIYDVVTTAQGATDNISLAGCDTLTSAGSDTLSVLGARNNIAVSGATTVTFIGGANVLAGGAGLLSVTDQFSGNSITGGAGGLNASLGSFDVVTTAAGAADTVSLTGYDNLTSLGADQINVAGCYSAITASGAATIAAGTGFNNFTLNGAENLACAGAANVTVGGGASAAISAAAGANMTIIKTAGGALSLTQAQQGGTASLLLTGGAATVTAQGSVSQGSAGQGGASNLVITSGGLGAVIDAGTGNATLNGGAGSDTVNFAGGNMVVNLGSGADQFNFAANTTGTLLINNFSAADSFGAGTEFTASSVMNGSTWLTLAGGGQVELVGFHT